jgi:8-oxo-dGTP pyrophosphatase MutT (NUDIX family)
MGPELPEREPDIHKAAAIIVRDRKLLVSRSKGKTIFIAPGGKLEKKETPKQALCRELGEEQGITVEEADLELFDQSSDIAAGHEAEQLIVLMESFIVKHFTGEPTPQAEVAENLWITSANEPGVPLGSIFEHTVIPKLVELDLID